MTPETAHNTAQWTGDVSQVSPARLRAVPAPLVLINLENHKNMHSYLRKCLFPYSRKLAKGRDLVDFP